MNRTSGRRMDLEENFILIATLIIADIEIHNHLYWLDDNKVAYPHLHLKLHKSIFQLIGFDSKSITPELEEWYFFQIEENFPVDTNSQLIMMNKTRQLIRALNKKRIELSKKM